MAAKEDILEQIVEEYLLHMGYFVRHNLKFRPQKSDAGFNSKQDSNHSDIDVIGFHLLKEGAERVVVVSCKSWQQGFSPRKQIDAASKNKKLGGREAWMDKAACSAFLRCSGVSLHPSKVGIAPGQRRRVSATDASG